MDPLEKDKKDMKDLNELLDQAINEVLQDTTAEFDIKSDPNEEPDYGYYGTVDSPDTFDLGKYNKTPKAEERNPHAHRYDASAKRFEGPFTGRDKKPTQSINWTEQFDQLEEDMKRERAKNENNVRNVQDSYQYQPDKAVNMQAPAGQREQDYRHHLTPDQQRYDEASARRPEPYAPTSTSSPPRQTARGAEIPYRGEKDAVDPRASQSRKQQPANEDVLNQRMREYMAKRNEAKSSRAPQSKRIMFNNDYFQKEAIPRPPREADRVSDGNAANEFQQQRPGFQQEEGGAEEEPEQKPDKKPEYFEYQGKKCTTSDPGGTLLTCPTFLRRSVWGALPAMKQLMPMKPPAEAVVFSLNTETPPCRDTRDCMRKVKEIQARHMGRDLGDIQYNFLVGGDGQLYEGRGWAYESGADRKPGEGPNLNVAFIGNYTDDPNQIPAEMITPVHDLVMWATVSKLLVGTAVRQDPQPLPPSEPKE